MRETIPLFVSFETISKSFYVLGKHECIVLRVYFFFSFSFYFFFLVNHIWHWRLSKMVFLLRLRLHVSRYPNIWILVTGCQRSGYLRSVYTCRIETFSAFTLVQTSGCIIRGILAMCRRNTQMLFFLVKLQTCCVPSNSLPFFVPFCCCFLAGRQGQSFVWWVRLSTIKHGIRLHGCTGNWSWQCMWNGFQACRSYVENF